MSSADAHAAAVEAMAGALSPGEWSYEGQPVSRGDIATAMLTALVRSEAVRAALVEAKTWPCSLCRGTGTFEYDDDCGDSTCGAPHPTKRVKCGACRGARFTPVGATATDAILAALAPEAT